MPRKVLVVDDSKLARMFVAKAITAANLGLVTVEAASVDQALLAISADRPDIALIDFNMPGKNGLDLVSEIRVKYPDMPIAIVTANIQEEISQRAAALNASFIAKPVEQGVLAAFLSEAVARIEAAI